MDVIATAGHVDHGKSALVRALTGMEPDRWAEERRRGMTIDLGFAWMTLPSGADVAFVDVPGHERFLGNMLAGVGPAPAVLFVIAADEGWQPQAEEHLQVIDALGVAHVLLVVTKSDLTDPAAAADAALRRIAATRIGDVAHVTASATTGDGLPELRAALDRLVGDIPAPDVAAPVRLWIDRAFTIKGAGSVVTGTVTGGTLRLGDRLRLEPAGREVTVRGLQSCGEASDEVAATARVAVNLRGVERADLRRGMALTTPGRWHRTTELDALITSDLPPAGVVVHVGSAAVPARLRRLSDRAIRVRLSGPLPLHVGDRLLLRDPLRRRVAAADVASLDPPPLRRRGDAARVGSALRVPTAADDVIRAEGLVRVEQLRAMGRCDDPVAARRVADWWVSPDTWSRWHGQLLDAMHNDPGLRDDDVPGGMPLPGRSIESLRHLLDVPAGDIVTSLAAEIPGLVVADGRVRPASTLTAEVPGLSQLTHRFAADPLAAPDADELKTIDPGLLAHAVRSGRLLHLGHGVYVGADAPTRVVQTLAGLPQPFTVSAARQALTSTRRVVLPLLEHLDAARMTRRLDDGRRVLLASGVSLDL
ncbi:MAG: selenocysteine-specific elongation factor [Frankiaceae bacterium]|nr:selenocysteine-specific elongation factor [Frankiaceae bacterium]